MKQVTGSNPRSSANKVSIQLALDGHSFCTIGLEGEHTGEKSEVAVLTPRTLLVPRELFAPEAAEGLLAAAGVPAVDGDRIVWSDPRAEVVAVMAAGSDALDAVVAKIGDRVWFTTPLLDALQPDTPTVWMLRTVRLLYIKVYEGTLRLAEVIPASTDADMLYLVERLEAHYTLKSFTLRTAGPHARAVQKLIGKRFKTTICEL